MSRACAGCRTQLSDRRQACAPCEARLPAPLADGLAQARRATDRAEAAAVAWLGTHPRVGDRELQAIAGLARGLTTDEIAAEMGISPLTVKTSVDRVMQRWGCRSRAALVATGYRIGYLTVTPRAGVS